MSKILKNTTGSDIAINDVGGETVPAGGQLIIDPANYDLFSRSVDVLAPLADGSLLFNDGSNDIADPNIAVRLLMGGLNIVKVEGQPAFADKVLPDGGKIYIRDWGEKFSVTAYDWQADPAPAPNELKLAVPFPHVKLDELEIIGGEKGDRVSFHVWDDTSGTYTTIPNYPLNQFGFMTGVAADHFKKKSKYDADLYYGMQIVIDYYSMSAKDILINYGFNEVK